MFLKIHLVPFFGGRPLHGIDTRDVEAYMAAKLREGKATKTVVNHLGLLFALFQFAERRGWAHGNPVALVERPARPRPCADKFHRGASLGLMSVAAHSLFAFDNSYVRELEGLYVPWQATPAPAPQLLALNEELASDLGLDTATLRSPDGVDVLVGNVVPEGASPVAQAYAGHQLSLIHISEPTDS